MPAVDSLPVFQSVVATGVRMSVTSAREAFNKATGVDVGAHAHWQCARWDVETDNHEVFDL